jgi:hypothetical protein
MEMNEKQLERLGRREGVLYVVCMCCGKILGKKDARGAKGGVSHGMCDPPCEEAKKRGFGK